MGERKKNNLWNDMDYRAVRVAFPYGDGHLQ